MLYFIFIGISLMILEVMTPGIFFFLALGIAFILNSITYFFTEDINISLIGTSIVTGIIYYFIKRLKLFQPKNNLKSNIDAYIGKNAIVQEKIGHKEYRIKVFSEIWTAKSEDELELGDCCKIEGRTNNTFIISKNQEEI